MFCRAVKLFVFAVQQYFLLKYKNTCTADNNKLLHTKQIAVIGKHTMNVRMNDDADEYKNSDVPVVNLL